MQLEMYILISTGIIAVISLLWSLIADYADKHVYCLIRQKEMSDEIQRLKHENLRYYALYGIIKDEGAES